MPQLSVEFGLSIEERTREREERNHVYEKGMEHGIKRESCHMLVLKNKRRLRS